MKTSQQKCRPFYSTSSMLLPSRWQTLIARLCTSLVLVVGIPALAGPDFPWTHEFFQGELPTRNDARFIGFAYRAQSQHVLPTSYIMRKSESLQGSEPHALRQPEVTPGDLCSAAARLRDETPPVIDIDYTTFANPASADQIIVRGKVTDPGQGSRGIDSVFVRNWEERFPITLIDNQFTAVIPLSAAANIFTFGAIDKAGNTTYKDIEILRASLTPLGFGFEDSFVDPILTPTLKLHGFVKLPAGDAVASAFVTTAQGIKPLQFSGNKFSVELPINQGDNQFNFTAISRKGTGITQELILEGSSIVEFQRIFTYGSREQPVRLIRGRIHSLWPAEALQLTIEGKPAKLTRESPGIYLFEQTASLSPGRNRLDFVVTTPTGESFPSEVDDWYEPGQRAPGAISQRDIPPGHRALKTPGGGCRDFILHRTYDLHARAK